MQIYKEVYPISHAFAVHRDHLLVLAYWIAFCQAVVVSSQDIAH